MSSIVELQKSIVNCTICPRLINHCTKVAIEKRRMYLDWDYWGKPLPSFGDPNARVLILGLAPAAHGGNRTGRMFTGDKSGDWVFRALHKFGFASSPDSTHREDGMILADAYITGALRCAPPQNKPTIEELSNCQTYLLQELELLTNVQVIIALGKIGFDTYLRALSAMNVQLSSPKPSFGHNKSFTLPNGKLLLGSYHPSQQNTQTGRLTEEMFDNVFSTAINLLE